MPALARKAKEERPADVAHPLTSAGKSPISSPDDEYYFFPK
jgi:hypothetical protein